MIDGLWRVMRGRFPAEACARWVDGVYRARAEWTADFDSEQFSLGRAFYTHLEQGRSRVYFEEATISDARVERYAPGLQGSMRALVELLVSGRVVARRGWCGPGVHIFPAHEKVAREGGVRHFDCEGLSRAHLAKKKRAVTLVAMLQPPTTGGGLRVWDVLYEGRDELEDDARAERSELFESEVGDVVAIDSYRYHQIQPFEGDRDRVSATVHAAEVDDGLWESWF